MVAAVTDRAVPVPIAIVAGQDPFEELLEVGLRARPGLHERDARGRVRHEDVDEPVPPDRRAERLDQVGDVHHAAVSRVDPKLPGVHPGGSPPSFGARPDGGAGMSVVAGGVGGRP
jgi:hypothetical protein